MNVSSESLSHSSEFLTHSAASLPHNTETLPRSTENLSPSSESLLYGNASIAGNICMGFYPALKRLCKAVLFSLIAFLEAREVRPTGILFFFLCQAARIWNGLWNFLRICGVPLPWRGGCSRHCNYMMHRKTTDTLSCSSDELSLLNSKL